MAAGRHDEALSGLGTQGDGRPYADGQRNRQRHNASDNDRR
ncbi:hypothetical protein I552_5384 [Mycobacterium xenopi 3993]|nr:hypothetical protein I552_5384 [Mycobacterium xenopi 3993]